MSAFMKEFSPKEQEDIFSLVEKISGTKKASKDKPHVFLNNIKRRMVEVNISNLYDYISYAKKNQNEYDHLVSSLTIHTTHWFREPRHFSLIENEVIQSFSKKKIRVLSLGCSTGEEVYSIALTLDKLRLLHPGFDYEVYGYDIDGVSVKKAVKCIYKDDGFEKIPEELKGNVLLGSGKTQGLMTLSKNIRERCHFDVMNALKIQTNDIGLFDIVFCRNMLIYFTTDQVQSIVRNLVNKLKVGGILCVGHSEDVSYYTKQLERLTGSTYRKNKEPKQQLSPL
ncbi:MAG: protein-glutamate O-methyltransferase CheR, partial [Oligoflexales bacterium]